MGSVSVCACSHSGLVVAVGRGGGGRAAAQRVARVARVARRAAAAVLRRARGRPLRARRVAARRGHLDPRPRLPPQDYRCHRGWPFPAAAARGWEWPADKDT